MMGTCDVAGDSQVPLDSGVAGLRLYEEPVVQHPRVTVRHYVFIGGCVTVRYSFTKQTAPSIFDEAQGLLGVSLRSERVNDIQAETGLTLCGAEAPPCPG